MQADTAAVLLTRIFSATGNLPARIPPDKMPRPPSAGMESNRATDEHAVGSAATRTARSVDQRTALAFAEKARKRAEDELEENAQDEKTQTEETRRKAEE